ncbi:MAG: hypothetical protein H8E66_08330 [Planctomycetes bacterium]|nr:hypothetical protein [Planctomycetota bacterium]
MARWFQCAVLNACFLSCSVAHARGPASIHNIPDRGNGHSLVALVLTPQNEALREELQISDRQLQELKDLRRAHSQWVSAILQQWGNQQKPQPNAEFETEKHLRQAHKDFLVGLKRIVTPEQFTRLRQIGLQHKTKFYSLAPLGWASILDELGLNDEEKVSFSADVKRRSDDLKVETIKLRAEIPDTLNRFVTDKQKQLLNDLLGEPFQGIEYWPSDTATAGIYRGQGMSPLLKIVRKSDVKKELEVLDEQDRELAALSRENRRLERELLSKHRRDRSNAAKLGLPAVAPPDDLLEKLRNEIDERLWKILVPPQVKRLQQLLFQSRVGGESTVPLLSKSVASAIGLTSEQHETLRNEYRDVVQRVNEQMDRDYYTAFDKVMGSLTSEQQKRYRELVGKRFDKWMQ